MLPLSYISVKGEQALFHHNKISYTLKDKGTYIEMLVWELPKKQEKKRTLVWFKDKMVVEWHKIVIIFCFYFFEIFLFPRFLTKRLSLFKSNTNNF